MSRMLCSEGIPGGRPIDAEGEIPYCSTPRVIDRPQQAALRRTELGPLQSSDRIISLELQRRFDLLSRDRVPDAGNAIPVHRDERLALAPRRRTPELAPAAASAVNRRGRLSWLPQSARLIRMGRSRPTDLASVASSRLRASHKRPRPTSPRSHKARAWCKVSWACFSYATSRACCALRFAAISAAALASARRHCHETRLKPRTVTATTAAESMATAWPALDPLPYALSGPRRPGQDRPPGQETVQILGQGRGIGVTPMRVLLQALQRDRLRIPGQARLQPRRWHRIGRLDMFQCLEDRCRLEGGAAGQHLIEDRSQRVDVGSRADRPGQALDLLWGRIARGPYEDPRLRQARVGLERLGQPEVHDLGGLVVLQQYVGRLEVAVDDPQAMRSPMARASTATIRAAGSGAQGVPSSRRARLPPSMYSISK